MPAVQPRPDPTAPSGALASLLAAVGAVPLALLAAAVGQGLGAALGGGGWIGVCLAWDRPVWALVNQPALNFAALPRAAGYWLGSTAAPLLVAVLAMPLSLRLRSLAGQLIAVQLAWSSVVLGALWQAGLDPENAHLTRWLEFRGLAPGLRLLIVAAAAVAVVPVTLRLLAVARITRHHMRRHRRIALVAGHLVPAPLAWALLSSHLRGALPVEAAATAAVPVVVALAVAWVGYPAPLTHPVAPVRVGALLGLLAVAALAWAGLALAGRPLPGDRVAAVQWAGAGSFNNIRPWMAPVGPPWLDDPHANRVPPG